MIRTQPPRRLGMLWLGMLWLGPLSPPAAAQAPATSAAPPQISAESSPPRQGDVQNGNAQDDNAPDETAASAVDSTNPVQPPVLLEQPAAVYPAEALAARQQSTVVLELTVDPSGQPQDIAVIASGGEAFNLAAVNAAQRYRFAPATQAGKPVAARIRIPFPFLLPSEHNPQPNLSPAPPDPASDHAAAAAATTSDSDEVIDVVVRGRATSPPRASSDFVLSSDLLRVTPRASAAELLQSAPGVYISRPEGDAVAHEVFLRGFDAEHGQDIEFSVGGLPLNQPSHIHGQGYADLNPIIPEVVRSIRVTEGVYDPRQGDFAVAGSVDFDLGVAQRGVLLQSAVGSFRSLRQLAIWAPEQQTEETFGALSLRSSDGFGQNRGSLAGGAIGQLAFDLPAEIRALAHVATYAARANLAGILRRQDVERGDVDFYGSYDQPTASAQSASALRTQASLRLERSAEHGMRSALMLWFSTTGFRSRENFSGYLQRSQQRPAWVGRGDLFEQSNDDVALGARFFHRSRHYEVLSWLAGSFEVGANVSTHRIEQAQRLLQAPQNETWDERVDAGIRETDIGGYLDTHLQLFGRVHLRGGVRADALHFDVEDRLGNFIPAFQPQTHLPGYRRTALGFSFGPRASLEVKLWPFLSAIAAYGEGYRSPQARQLEEGENAPFAKLHAAEGGLRLRLGATVSATAAVYATFLDQDLAFDPGSGSLTRIGPTRRAGFVGEVTARPVPYLFASASLTYVQATLRAPPPATADNPAPAFKTGQLLPYVPPLVGRVDLGLSGALFGSGDDALHGEMGLGTSLLSSRPLPYGQFSPTVWLVSLAFELHYRLLTLGLVVDNLLDRRYAASEYSFVSDWGTREVPSLLPARHFAAGAPRTITATLTLQL